MDAQGKSSADEMQRVEVYNMNEGGNWYLRGTGHVSIEYCQGSENVGWFVIVEDDRETILKHRISSADIYRMQEETMISWLDPDLSTDLALSFQDNKGRSFIWGHIYRAQCHLQLSNLGDETPGLNSELRELPSVDFSTLPFILKIVVETGATDPRHVVDLVLQRQIFFQELMYLFRACEKELFSTRESLEDFQRSKEIIDILHIIFKLVKGIISLNSPDIFEKLFGDEFIMDVIGCLEYDPDALHHRALLKEHVVFKEAIPIKDPIVFSKIHQTYKIGYIKDVILSRVSDEATIGCMNSIIQSNNAIVVSLLKDDSAFIQELFARMQSPTKSAESQKNLILFVQELCSSSKSMQFLEQLQLFQDFVNKGLFDIVTDVLKNTDKSLALAGTDILILSLNQDPSLLGTYVIQQEGNSLFELLVNAMIMDGGVVSCRVLKILQTLLDSYTMSRSQVDTLVVIFCQRHLDQLADVVECTCRDFPDSETAITVGGTEFHDVPIILSNICELVCFSIHHHLTRMKPYLLGNDFIEKILWLTERKEIYLSVAAVRFMRTIIACKDEQLLDLIQVKRLLVPIMKAECIHGSSYLPLEIAIQELRNYISDENIATLGDFSTYSFFSGSRFFSRTTFVLEGL